MSNVIVRETIIFVFYYDAGTTFLVKTLLAGGTTPDTVRTTLAAHGYTPAQIDELLAAAGAPMVADQVPAVPAANNKINETTTSTGLPHWLVVTLVVGLFFILAGATTFAFVTGRLQLPSFITNLFSQAPYEPETVISDIYKGFSQISSADFVINLEATSGAKDADTYLLPREIADSSEVNFTDYLAMVPRDFSFAGSLSGGFDLGNESAGDSYTRVTGDYSASDLSVNVDVEVVAAKEEGLFVRINRMPPLFIFDFSPVKGSWLHLIEESLSATLQERFDEQGVDRTIFFEQISRMAEIADQHQVLTISDGPIAESVNGTTAYKYTLAYNQPALRSFLEDVVKTINSEYGNDSMLQDYRLDAASLDRVTSAAYVDYLNTHLKLVVWARADGVPVKFGTELRVAIDDDAPGPLEKARAQGLDAGKKAVLNNVRADAELYYDKNQRAYVGYCNTADPDRYAPLSRYDFDEYICRDRVDAYAISIDLSNGHYCVDSTGFAGYGSVGLEFACIEETPVTPISTEPLGEADRQVNASLLIELHDINEPVTVDIPTDALSREEAIKRMPLLEGMIPKNKPQQPNIPTSDTRQTELNRIRAEAEIYYDENSNSYAGLCSHVKSTHGSLVSGGASCAATTDAYAIETPLTSGLYYCVDSTGYAATKAQSTINGVSCTLLKETASAPASQPINSVPPPASTPATNGSLEVQYSPGKIITGYSGAGFTEGQAIVAIPITLRNGGSAPQNFSTSDLRLRDTNGIPYYVLSDSSLAGQPRFSSPVSYSGMGLKEIRSATVYGNEELRGLAVFYVSTQPTPAAYTIRYRGGLPESVTAPTSCQASQC